jgi:hypothetical protein
MGNALEISYVRYMIRHGEKERKKRKEDAQKSWIGR